MVVWIFLPVIWRIVDYHFFKLKFEDENPNFTHKILSIFKSKQSNVTQKVEDQKAEIQEIYFGLYFKTMIRYFNWTHTRRVICFFLIFLNPIRHDLTRRFDDGSVFFKKVYVEGRIPDMSSTDWVTDYKINIIGYPLSHCTEKLLKIFFS